MKTKHITLAILAAASAGAFASAAYADDTSGVTISGFVRAGVEGMNSNANQAWGYTTANGATSTNAKTSTTSVAGRTNINFNGVENLGNGLSAVFQVNNRFSPTGNNVDDEHGYKAGTFASDDSFVGLKSTHWGEIRLGKGTGNFEDGKYDNSYVVGPDQLIGWFGDSEGNNMVRYDLPSFMGGALNASFQYATEENKTASVNATQHYIGNVSYDNGQWGVSVALSSSPNTTNAFAWATNSSSAPENLTQSHLTASYKPIDSVQLAVEMQRDTWAGNTQNKAALYAYYTTGAFQFGLQGGTISYSGNKAVGLNSDKFIDGFVHYSLSKQTTVYLEALSDKDGAVSYANSQTGSRNLFIVGLNKAF